METPLIHSRTSQEIPLPPNEEDVITALSWASSSSESESDLPLLQLSDRAIQCKHDSSLRSLHFNTAEEAARYISTLKNVKKLALGKIVIGGFSLDAPHEAYLKKAFYNHLTGDILKTLEHVCLEGMEFEDAQEIVDFLLRFEGLSNEYGFDLMDGCSIVSDKQGSTEDDLCMIASSLEKAERKLSLRQVLGIHMRGARYFSSLNSLEDFIVKHFKNVDQKDLEQIYQGFTTRGELLPSTVSNNEAFINFADRVNKRLKEADN